MIAVMLIDSDDIIIYYPKILIYSPSVSSIHHYVALALDKGIK